MMTNREKIEKLMGEFRFNEVTAKAWVEFRGRCGYCGEDLISSPFRYYSGQTDHLLPKAKYPELAWDVHNAVPCCGPCNQLKGDPLREEENAKEMLNHSRQELIHRVQAVLMLNINERLNQYNRIRAIILDC